MVRTLTGNYSKGFPSLERRSKSFFRSFLTIHSAAHCPVLFGRGLGSNPHQRFLSRLSLLDCSTPTGVTRQVVDFLAW